MNVSHVRIFYSVLSTNVKKTEKKVKLRCIISLVVKTAFIDVRKIGGNSNFLCVSFYKNKKLGLMLFSKHSGYIYLNAIE